MQYVPPPLPSLPLPPVCTHVTGIWWRPNPVFVQQLAAFLQGKRVLEIFAGNGYLAGLLQAQGVDITATTIFASHDCHELGLYFPVEELDAVSAVQRYGADHDVLLLCWPTTVPAAFRAAQAWGSEKDIVYVGEVTDYSKFQLASCATDAFFEHMEFGQSFDAYEGNRQEVAAIGRFRPSKN